MEEKGIDDPYVSSVGGAAFLSSRECRATDSTLVAFNGVVTGVETGREEAWIQESYEQHGIDFLERATGDFRVAIYDRDRDALHVATDKSGNNLVFYSEADEGFAFSSHISPLLALPWVDAELDGRAARKSVLYSPVSFGGERTLVRDVSRLLSSHYLRATDDGVASHRYWTPFDGAVRDISDSEAVDRIESLLSEAADMYIDDGEDVNVMFSGGFDSSLLTRLLQERDDVGAVKTCTMGYSEDILRRAREKSARYGTEHTEIKFSPHLPSERYIWDAELPGPLNTHYRVSEAVEEWGESRLFHGGNASLPFPVGLDRLRSLERLRRGRYLRKIVRAVGIPLARAARSAGIVGPGTYNNMLNGLDIAGAETPLVALTRPMNLNPRYLGVATDHTVEREMGERWNLESDRLDELVLQYDLRERVKRWSNAATNVLDDCDIFSYSPLLELTYRLPMPQKQGRRLARRIARERFPEIEYMEPGGAEEGAVGFRKILQNDAGKFERALERFMARDLFGDDFRSAVSNRDRFTEKAFFKANLYAVETWIETYIDREDPWRSP